MTIAVAHGLSAVSDAVLVAGAREAAAHGARLAVLHVVTASDLDSEEALQRGISDLLETAIDEAGITGVDWDVVIVPGTTSGVDDVATALLRAATEKEATMLVIGARRRSPVGKALLGSVTQELILEADLPVLVVTSAPSH